MANILGNGIVGDIQVIDVGLGVQKRYKMGIPLQVTAKTAKPEYGAIENPRLSNIARIVDMDIQEKQSRHVMERLGYSWPEVALQTDLGLGSTVTIISITDRKCEFFHYSSKAGLPREQAAHPERFPCIRGANGAVQSLLCFSSKLLVYPAEGAEVRSAPYMLDDKTVRL